jgi:hypothetical protein
MPRYTMPYSAHVASVACRRPASQEMKDHHVKAGFVASELTGVAGLSGENVSGYA